MEKKTDSITITEEQKKNYVDAVIRLCAYAVHGERPAEGWVQGLDLDLLYRMAERHLLTGIVAYALEAAGIKDARFTQAKGKAIRKVATMDFEMARVFEEFDRAGIWHAPLKGIVLKDLYPEVGMRQMCDHDILIDTKRAEQAREIMEGLGFETASFGTWIHDTYHKDPVCNFELHLALFPTTFDERIVEYYGNVAERLLKDEGEGSGYHFSPEDFYVYITAHEYKHYTGSGTGLRSLLDTYVYLRHYEGCLDMEYVQGELAKLGLTGFEQRNRVLAQRLFTGQELTREEEMTLRQFSSSGTYGTMENLVKNSLKKIRWDGMITPQVKLRYLLGRMFPGRDYLYPTYRLAKYRLSLPLAWSFRAVRAMLFRGKEIFREIGFVRKARC